ncbi:MAG TPA: ABC transporter permease [Vicinamibacteria bacterium]
MKRVFAVARREYLERVRSKAFLVSTILGPTLLAGFMIAPILLTRQRGRPLHVAVLDASGSLGADVTQSLARRKVGGEARFVVETAPDGPVDQTRAALQERMVRSEIDGYLFLAPDALERSAAEYYGKNVSNVMDLQLMDKAVEEALVSRRLAREGLDPERVRSLTRRVDLKTVRVTARGAREDRGASFILSLVLMMLLYTTLAVWGAAMMNGVIEEKANRVVEVVVSSLPASRLFAGKLVGVGAAGLTQFVVWAACLAAISAAGAAGTGAAAALPELSPLLLVAFVLFFLLGYFLYGAMYASIGAAVNTTQEAQTLVLPVMMPLILSVVFYPMVLAAPDSTLSVVLSLVPFFAPLLMFLRMTTVSPPAWQVALSMLLMLAAIAVITWAAARIYRVGILMYGKRPTFPEIIRWVGRP